ncbi:hypothetical protein WJX72_009152 [[Myrmecia] bisecta]|uniref:Uncharacterized protein n=1 Tax=[Myrmecia] bisecta TaxID=41462 RepID=A0AAW1PNB9_9CHLO
MFKLLGLLAVVGGGAFLLFRRHRRNASRAPPSGPSKKTASSGTSSLLPGKAAAAAEDRVSQARQALYTITENELIVHELLLQGGPSSPAQQDAEDAAVSAAGSNPMEGIRQIAERAFWDALQEGLQAQPPQWERIAALIGDARDQLVELIPATSQQGLQLRADLRDKLDMEYISMRLAAGFDPQYLRQLFDYLVFVIMGLEAPARSRSTKQGYAQLTQAFAFAPPASASRDAAGKLVDVHMDVEHSTRVPVDLVAHEAWLPVDVQPVETTTPSSARSSASSASLARHQRSENVNPNQAGLAQTAAAKAQASGETTPRAGSGPDAQPSDSSSSGNGNGDWVPMRRASVATAEQDEGTVMVGGSPSQPQEPTAAGVQGSSDSSGSGHGSPRTGSDDDGILVGIPSPQGPALQSADTAAMLVEASKFVFEKVGQLRKDMARARLEMLKGLLQGTAGGVDYERRRLANAIGELPAREALPNTQRWLASTAHLDPAPSPHLEEKAFIRGLLAEGLLQLLQAPEALSPQQCPETLLLDCRRIVALQNELQRLALVAAALLIAQQLLAVKQVSSTTSLPENRRFYVAVKERLSSLLAQPDVRMDVLIEAMAALLAERCSSAGSGPSGSSPSSTSVTLSGGPGGGSGDSELVARMLGRIFSTSDPVFQKVQRGIVGALRVLLQLHGPTHLEDCNARLRTIGAELLAQEVQAMADVMRRMISLTAEVSEPYYRAIAQGLRTQLLSPRPQAT